MIKLNRFGCSRIAANLLAVLLLATSAGCLGSGTPRVEVMENGVYNSVKVSAYRITGARNGATTHAVATVTLDDGDTVSIEMDVAYNPQPELASGHWKREGRQAEEGDVHAESLKFLGGQGAAPSVGGRFRLESFGNPRMRVTLPARTLERPLN